jgi:putative aldouronate transport system substrate-binding protein
MGWSKKRVFGAVCSFTVGSLLFASGAQESGGAASGGLGSIGFRKEGFPIVEAKTDLRIMARRDVFHRKEFDQFAVVREMEEKTNIRVLWDLVPANAWTERVNLAFASGDLPEIFFRGITKTMQLQYGEQGLIVPLGELLAEYAPNLRKYYDRYASLLPAATTPDGKLYALPGRDPWGFNTNPDVMLVNTEWLSKLNLSMPTTPAEFENVLRAFKTRDPNGNGKADEIPLSFRWDDPTQGPSSLFGLFGLLDYPALHLVVRNGRVVFTADKNEHREALKWFAKLYAEGLIDQEALVQDVRQYTAKGMQGLYGVFFDWSGINIVGPGPMDSKRYDLLPPMTGSSGRKTWKYHDVDVTHGEVAITRAVKYPAVAMRWIDATAETLTNMQWSAGPIGLVFRREGSRLIQNDPPAGVAFAEFRHSEAPGRTMPVFWTGELAEVVPSSSIVQKFEFMKRYAPHFTTESYPDVFFLSRESEELSTLRTDIVSYVVQKQAEWVMGGNIDAEWNAYVRRLEQMGLPRYLEIHQTALNRFRGIK